MKFGAKLRAYAVPAWQAAYVRYDALKALISRYEAELQAARKQEEQEVERQHLQELQRFDVTPSSGGYPLQRLLPQATQARSSDAVDSSALLHAVNAEGATSSVNVPGTKERIARGPAGDVGNGEIVQRVRRKAVEEFDVVLAGEVVKVERHFWKELRAVEDRLRAVEEELYLLIPQRRVRELQVSSRCRGQESELHSRPDSSFISRSPLRHSGSAGGLAFRSEPVSKRRHLKRSSRERLGGPAPCAVREGSTSFTCPGEHASGEGYSSSDDGGEVGTAPSTAKALSATESIGLLHTARGHLHNRHDRSRNSGRATKGANATQKGEATSPVKAVSHSAQEDVDNTEANGARIRGLHASTRTAQESSESKGLDVEDVHFVADSEDEGTVHGHRTASRSAELAVEAPGDSCRSGDFDAKWGDYGPSLLSSNRHPSSNSSGEPREESSAVRRVFPQPDVDDDFLSSGGEGAIHAVEREAHVAHLRRLQRVIILILDSFEKLQGFANLNLICVYKILKKRDKKLGTQLLRESFTYYESRLNALVIPRTLKCQHSGNVDKRQRMLELGVRKVHAARQWYEEHVTAVVALYRRTCRAAGEEDGVVTNDALHSFHRLQMAVQKDMLFRRASAVASRSRPLYFALGCLLVLFVNVLILASRKPSNPNFREETLIAYLPIYRFMFECSFATMACAISMACMEAYGVNYKFLLDIDPKSQVDSTTIFGLATLQQLLFFFVFALFLLDYKFAVFGTHDLYWLYMPVLVVLELLLLTLPHPTFRLTYRKHIVSTVVRVFRAGLLLAPDVTLLQNLVGDVLTSFSKPLGDLEYIVCFYATGLDHAAKPECIGESWIRPVLVGIPFYLRLCQCICRYRARKGDEQTQRLHVLNCGKYIAGILVIVCNSLPWQSFGVSPYSTCLIWVCSYVCGTIYMFFWDVKVDWGLMPDPDHFLRAAGRSMYPPWTYQSIAVGNLIGRLTWATTLMPMSFSSLRSHLLNLMISVVEISRRAAWVVLRLENEHISNSSKYRATLWVPPLYQSSGVFFGEGEKLVRVKTWPAEAHRLQGEAYSAAVLRHDREDMVPSSPSPTSVDSYFCEDSLPERSMRSDEGDIELLVYGRERRRRPYSF